jgi:hypothetical protein
MPYKINAPGSKRHKKAPMVGAFSISGHGTGALRGVVIPALAT